MTLFCHFRGIASRGLRPALRGLLLGLLSGSAVTAAAPAEDASLATVEEFYAGRRLIMISGYTPDGGDRQQERLFAGMTITSGVAPRGEEDIHGRLLARHMGRHLPGRPHFIVQTMPGAGGRRAADHLYRHAARDGSVIGNVARGIALNRLLSLAPDRGAFDALSLNWLGSLRSEVGFVVAWHTAGTRTAEDLFESGMLVGGLDAQDDSVLLARALNGLLGTRLKIIAGYGSALALQIAMERGEIAGYLAGSSDVKSRLIPWIQTGQARALLQLGLQRDPDLPNVPLALDFARSEKDRQALALIFARQALGAPYAAPPGVPSARVAALRAAFGATMADGAFRADAARLQIAIAPLPGDEVLRVTARLFTTPEAVRRRAAAALAGGAPPPP